MPMPRSTVTSRASRLKVFSRGPAQVAVWPERTGRSGETNGPLADRSGGVAELVAPCGAAHATLNALARTAAMENELRIIHPTNRSSVTGARNRRYDRGHTVKTP